MLVRSPAAPGATPAERFRRIIEEAAASGADLSRRALQLTYSDSAKLKRDRSVSESEISFESGEMTFIGVRVIEGASTSALMDVDAIVGPPNSAHAEVSAMAKGQKKSNKEVRKPKAEKPKPAPAGRDFTSPPSERR